jgi:uncharacterized coiled-coil protein SlyX
MTTEDRLKKLEAGIASLTKRVANLEEANNETRQVYETMSETLNAHVGDVNESVANTMSHLMNTVDKRIKKVVSELEAESKEAIGG